MDNRQQMISVAACKLAAELPLDTLQIVARLVAESASLGMAKAQMDGLPHPHHRQLATTFIDQCTPVMPPPTPQAIALALLTAGVSERIHQDSQSVELVWTGPDVGAVPFRRTEQAIIEVLDSAQSRVTLVCYAVYSVSHVSQALVKAAQRGVTINVIVETPDKIIGESEYNTIRALGPEVAACCSVYFWPKEKRQSYGEKFGILHVKCAVADGRWLFLSSANLTAYAFSINMELGVLLIGGSLPGQVEENFDRMIAMRVLEKI